MSAKDPDVRSESESALRDQLARSEERICMLEAQLAVARESLPAECADMPRPPASARPPISMSAFNSNSFGPSTEGIAAVVQTAANTRHAPLTPKPASDTSESARDNFEPTARLDVGELRDAHRALTRPRALARRRMEVGLLCLACGTLWAGLWQMRVGERHSQSANRPQDAAAVSLASVPPISAPDAAQHKTDSPVAVAAVANAATILEPDAAPRPADTSRPTAPISPSVSVLRRAQTAAGNSRQDTNPVPTRSQARSIAERRPTPLLHPISVSTETPLVRRTVSRKTLARTTGWKRDLVRPTPLIAFVPHHIVSFKPGTHTAVVFPPQSRAQNDYGLRSGGSESSEEQVEEQAESVHGMHTAAYSRDDRRSDIETNVDHAIQTLDKMKELLDNMEHRRKAPAHP